MNRRTFLATWGSLLALPGCLAPFGNGTEETGTPCPTLEADTSCDPMKESVVKADPGAPADSYRSSIILPVESLPRCERAIAEQVIDRGSIRICGTGPPSLGSLARRASEQAEDHELYLASEGTGYRLYIQIQDQVFVG